MKYPQLVSMPSTVQDWLDEQLEARGIDAVVYTRYIFSLLQRDTLDLPDDLLTLSPSKSKEVGRRGRKRGRREEYWDVWDCEQLKRSAAVECLMSASDQKFGIEKLVDELCAKLKEIQSEGEDTPNKTQPFTSEAQRLSPSDQAQKYYAAFPPLSKCDDSDCKAGTVIPCPPSAWGNKNILSNSFGKNKQNIGGTESGHKPFDVLCSTENKENQGKNEVDKISMKSRNQENDKYVNCNAEKERGFGFAWNMSAVWCHGNSEQVPRFDSITTGWRVCKYNIQNREEMENIEESLEMGKEIWNTGHCHRDKPPMSDLKSNSQNESIENSERESGQYVDENLAQLIAKFDHSIEALWSPSENVSPEENMDSASPLVTSLSINAELSSSVINHLPASNSGHSFLHCGTNITNSIWSTHPPITKSLSSDDKIQLEQLNTNSNFDNGTAERNGEIGIKDLKLRSNDKNFGNKSTNADDMQKGITCQASVPFRNIENNMIVDNLKNDMAKEWNNLDSFPSNALTSGLPSYSGRDRFRIASDKGWPISGSSESVVGNFPRYNMFPNYQKIQNSGNFTESSFGNLNHNKEDSSFTEVIPKQSFCKFNSVNRSPHVNKTRKHSDGLFLMSGVTKETTEGAEKEKEEEDLLTSTRTHFRPIRQDNPDAQNNNTAYYADGTTFVIPNSWESVPFKRSESGALYLETDLGIETPKKYMEYKEKELYSVRHKTVKSPDSAASLRRDFVPKFRVHQIEKCCQTEESEECMVSDEEIDTKRSRQDLKSLDSEFYFPGDEHFAEKVVNCLESDDERIEETTMETESFSLVATSCANEVQIAQLTNQSEHQSFRAVGNEKMFSKKMAFQWSDAVKNCCKCSHNFSAWKNGWQKDTDGLRASKDGIWGPSGTTVRPHAWSDIWSSTYDSGAEACGKCGGASKISPIGLSPQRLKLREELSQDGEQLLSDLSYMQYLYQGSDSNDSVASCIEKMQCLSPPTETSNDVQLYDDSEFDIDQLQHCRSSPVLDYLHGKENESFGDFVASCTPKMLPVKVLLSMEVGPDKKMNERPFSLKMSAKDRKRRHSGCLRQISNNQCPENYNIGLQVGYESSAAVGCHISTAKDSVRFKGPCSSRSLRPVTL